MARRAGSILVRAMPQERRLKNIAPPPRAARHAVALFKRRAVSVTEGYAAAGRESAKEIYPRDKASL